MTTVGASTRGASTGSATQGSGSATQGASTGSATHRGGSANQGGGSVAERAPKRPLSAERIAAGLTLVVLVVLAVLALVLAAQGLWFFLHDRNAPDQAADADRGAISVPEDRPILAESSAAQAAADQAAKAGLPAVHYQVNVGGDVNAETTIGGQTYTANWTAEQAEAPYKALGGAADQAKKAVTDATRQATDQLRAAVPGIEVTWPQLSTPGAAPEHR